MQNETKIRKANVSDLEVLQKIGRQTFLETFSQENTEENLRAISFYKKNGFMEFDKHIFKLGDDEQTDIMMKLKLE